REGKEGDQALGRRPQGHELRRPCCPSRHLHSQHHARANKPATPLHPLSPTNPTPRGRLQADRHRPRPCPVTKNTDCQINQSDQSLAPPPNENFGLATSGSVIIVADNLVHPLGVSLGKALSCLTHYGEGLGPLLVNASMGSRRQENSKT